MTIVLVADVSHVLSLGKSLNEQRKQPNAATYCDVILRADGHSIPAHSCVLAASGSEFFRRLIESVDTTNKTPGFIRVINLFLPEDDRKNDTENAKSAVLVLEDIVDYLYTGQIEVAEYQLTAAVALSRSFRLNDLNRVLLAHVAVGDQSAATNSDNGDKPPEINFVSRIERNTTPKRQYVVKQGDKRFLSSRLLVSGTGKTNSASETKLPIDSYSETGNQAKPGLGANVTHRANDTPIDCIEKLRTENQPTKVKRVPKRQCIITENDVTVLLDDRPDDVTSQSNDVEPTATESRRTKPKRIRAVSLTSNDASSGRVPLYRCKRCRFRSRNQEDILNHKNLHSLSRNFACRSCSYYTGVCSRLLTHLLETDHPDETRCSLCEHVASDHDTFLLHLKRHGEDPKTPFFCEYCDKRYQYSSFLDTHQSSHANTLTSSLEQRHVCDQCGYRTAFKRCLWNHMKIKHRLKMGGQSAIAQWHSCPEPGCAYQTWLRGNLACHLRTHTGEKPYQCDICGAQFSQKSSLKMHTMRHDKTGTIPRYHCERCTYNTIAYANMYRHNVQVHGVKPSKLKRQSHLEAVAVLQTHNAAKHSKSRRKGRAGTAAAQETDDITLTI